MFNVGDKVIAKPITPYNITTSGWKGIVVKVKSDIKIFVQDLRYAQDVYDVNPIYFDLLEEK